MSTALFPAGTLIVRAPLGLDLSGGLAHRLAPFHAYAVARVTFPLDQGRAELEFSGWG